uniref:PH domain-containing protein n=1 Tax=Hydatigena taeniaeformis TaxID=6205 RepID=A0A0R3XBK2_HYDTA
LTESDLEPYKDFSLVVSERWQLEIAETVFDVVNQETDRIENKRRSKQQHQVSQHSVAPSSNTAPTSNTSPFTSSSSSQKVLSTSSSDYSAGEISISVDPHSAQLNSDCIVEGDILKLVGPFFQTWQRKFLRLFPNRLEIHSKSRDGTVVKKGVELVSMVDIREISRDFQRMYKMDNCLTITLKNDSKITITSTDKVLITQWKEEIEEAFQTSNQLISNLNKKAHKVYGAESPPQPSTPEQLATRTPTRSNPAAATESIGMQNLVRQTSAPSVGLQKSLNKLYSFTTYSGGASGHFERSPAKSMVGPIAEGDGENREGYHSSRDDA